MWGGGHDIVNKMRKYVHVNQKWDKEFAILTILALRYFDQDSSIEIIGKVQILYKFFVCMSEQRNLAK